MDLRRIPAARVAAAAAALAGTACSRGGAAADPARVAETDTCSVTRVAQSPPATELANVYGLDVDSRGRIYAISSPGVAVLAPDGTLLRRIGRAGSGPGEFRALIDVQVLPGDSLMTYDRELNRITVFPPDADTAAYSVSLLAAGPLAPPGRVRALPAQRGFLALHQRPASADGDDPGLQVVRLLNWDGTLRRDSVATYPAPGYMLIARENGRISAGFNPFGIPNLVRAGPDGRVYFGRGDSLAVHVFGVDGRPAGGFADAYTPPPVTAADLDRAGADVKGNPMLEKAVRQQAPRRWPAFHNFVVDGGGGVWVGLKQPFGQPTRWAVYDGAGRRRCSVVFPEQAGPEVIRGGRVYAVTRDSLDVPSVSIYRLDQRPKGRTPR